MSSARQRPGLWWPMTRNWSLSGLSHSRSPPVKALIWSTKRWQYFTEYAAASGEVGDYQEPLQHWFTASPVWIGKKKVLWELVKEYLRSILSSHSLLHLYMARFDIYTSLLDWIPLLALSSSVCLKDKRVSCNVDEVICCIRVNLFVKTDEVISCVVGSLAKMVQRQLPVLLSSDCHQTLILNYFINVGFTTLWKS